MSGLAEEATLRTLGRTCGCVDDNQHQKGGTEHDEDRSARIRADGIEFSYFVQGDSTVNRPRLVILYKPSPNAIGLHSWVVDGFSPSIGLRDADLPVVSDFTERDLSVGPATSRPDEKPDQGQRDRTVSEHGSPPVNGGGTVNVARQSQVRVRQVGVRPRQRTGGAQVSRSRTSWSSFSDLRGGSPPMRRWNSLMPQGGLTCSGHALQTTYARTTARTQTIKTGPMVSITSIYPNAQDAPQGPRQPPAGKVALESKDDLKARIGRSPDRADAVSQAFGAKDRSMKIGTFRI